MIMHQKKTFSFDHFFHNPYRNRRKEYHLCGRFYGL
ncbi:hypothetical protein SAMN05428962_2800 [Paenibacillus sp. BC26]|nr:hypothetical protein SAMN05428962_2800 [Paenibacillus sp. BC26]